MNDISTLAPALHGTVRPGEAAAPAEAPRRHYGVVRPRSIIAAWRERIRIRWELEQKARHNPYLIDDIGLTKPQLEAEIAKPFWQR